MVAEGRFPAAPPRPLLFEVLKSPRAEAVFTCCLLCDGATSHRLSRVDWCWLVPSSNDMMEEEGERVRENKEEEKEIEDEEVKQQWNDRNKRIKTDLSFLSST